MITAGWVVLGIVAMIGIFAYRVWSVLRECARYEIGIGPYLCGCIDIPKEGALGKVMEGEGGEEEIGENVGKVIHGEEGEDKAEGTVEGEVLSLEGNGGAISLDDVWVEVKDAEKEKGAGKENVAVVAELKAALKGKDRESEGMVVAKGTVKTGSGWSGWY